MITFNINKDNNSFFIISLIGGSAPIRQQCDIHQELKYGTLNR